MKVQLEGTGTAEGLPVAGCPCVTCRATLAAGQARRPLRALVDDRVLLTEQAPEPGPAIAPAGPGCWTVTAHGARLLWAPSGELPQLAAGGYEVVLLGVGTDLASWPLRVAELRRTGVVHAGTQLLAVGIGHTEPPLPELAATLALWGAWAPDDGALVDATVTGSVPLRSRRALVLGGARSGKSAYAELRLAAEPAVRYVATAPQRPSDADWQARIAAHAARRPPTWQTVETTDVARELTGATPVLVDDLGLWLAQLLDRADAWTGPLPTEVDRAVEDLVQAWSACTTGAVLVAPEVGGGVIPGTASGRRFRDLLGAVSTRLARASDEVVQVVAGLPRTVR